MSCPQHQSLRPACPAVVSGLLAAAPQPSEEEIRRTLQEVLSRPEFAPETQPAWILWLLERLGDFFSWLTALHQTAPALFWLLLLGCLLLLVVLLGHFVWTVRRVLYRQSRLIREESSDEQRERLSRIYESQAHQRAAAADFTEAIRCLFLALVYRFDEKGRVSFQQACTNREYLNLFADRPRFQNGLRVFVDLLDDYWYGQRLTDSRHYEDCLSLFQELVRA